MRGHLEAPGALLHACEVGTDGGNAFNGVACGIDFAAMNFAASRVNANSPSVAFASESMVLPLAPLTAASTLALLPDLSTLTLPPKAYTLTLPPLASSLILPPQASTSTYQLAPLYSTNTTLTTPAFSAVKDVLVFGAIRTGIT